MKILKLSLWEFFEMERKGKWVGAKRQADFGDEFRYFDLSDYQLNNKLFLILIEYVY